MTKTIRPAPIAGFFFLLLLSLQCSPVREVPVDEVVKAFLGMPAAGQTTSFTNQLPVNNEGGHLQGVQYLRKGKKEYAILSGSSSTYAYYAVARLGAEPQVTGIHKILDKPYKHAGGFQIYQNLMAVGVEDNDARDRSKVFIYRISDPESPPEAPVAVIERRGDYQRATAGCIGLTRLNDQLLLVVGDWDSKHLDFYTAPYPSRRSDALSFELIHTIDTEKADKSAWIDPDWLSYQNINLLRDAKDRIYLVGTAGNSQGEDVADLFELNPAGQNGFQLRKIAGKNFGARDETKFRWGAGIFHDSDGKLRILSCGENLWEASFLTWF